MAILDFDGFIQKKNSEKAFFICLMDGECQYLDSDTHWVHHAPFKIHLVRLSKDEFNALHIGIHPKVLKYDHGREIKSWNGVPNYDTFAEEA